MPQASFDPLLSAFYPGQLIERVTSCRLPNPLRAQVGEIDVNAVTTDGTYTFTIRDYRTNDLLGTFSYVAVSKSAAQIAAGLSAAALADPVVRGLLNDTGSDVSETDSCNLYFRKAGKVYTITQTSGTTVVVSNRTEAGYTAVGAGEAIQSDDAGGFEQFDGDGPQALGVVLRNSELVYREDTGLSNIDGPSELDILQVGIVAVEFASGEAVLYGDGPVAYNATTKNWKKAAGGSWVVMEGTQVRSNGSGVQAIYLALPLTA